MNKEKLFYFVFLFSFIFFLDSFLEWLFIRWQSGSSLLLSLAAALFLILFFFFSWQWGKSSFFKKASLFIAVVLVVGGNYFHSLTRNLHLYPQVFSVKPKLGVQGQEIKIKGLNLTQALSPGKVYLGKDEVQIISWRDDLMIVEQPVLGRFGWQPLRIVCDKGEIVVDEAYHVLDPDELKNYE